MGNLLFQKSLDLSSTEAVNLGARAPVTRPHDVPVGNSSHTSCYLVYILQRSPQDTRGATLFLFPSHPTLSLASLAHGHCEATRQTEQTSIPKEATHQFLTHTTPSRLQIRSPSTISSSLFSTCSTQRFGIPDNPTLAPTSAPVMAPKLSLSPGELTASSTACS